MSEPVVAIVGLGCIGGSLARALKARDVAVRGWSISDSDCERARAAGIEVPATLATTVRGAELVVLAVPADALAVVACAAAEGAPADVSIVHCGGMQRQAALHLDDATYARVLGAHPIAGSHETGFAASCADLFVRCTVIVETRASAKLRAQMSWLWGIAGAARVEYLTADAQDAMMTWISHLPQLAATALAAALASRDIDPRSAGPGARDSTRLAASPFDQWAPLVEAQPALLDEALAALERTVGEIRAALASGDRRALETIWSSGREWRRAAERDA